MDCFGRGVPLVAEYQVASGWLPKNSGFIIGHRGHPGDPNHYPNIRLIGGVSLRNPFVLTPRTAQWFSERILKGSA